MSKFLTIQNLDISFQSSNKNLKTVKNFNLNLSEKESLGIVGESGSGKTLSMLALTRLLPKQAAVSAGSIIFQNKNLNELNNKNFYKEISGKKISMIFQEPMTALNPVHTIGKQLLDTYLYHNNESVDRGTKRALEILDAVRLPKYKQRMGQYPHQLSGGQRQRVMIALALINNPSLLIADEPTTALDVTIQAQVINLIKDIILEYQMGVIFITHDLGVIAQIADDVAVMYLGSVVEKGPVNKILKNPKHPYTKGLLEALPDVNNLDATLRPIPGNIPSPLDRPSACVFRTRCPNPCDNCRNGNTEMGLIEVEPGHWVDQCCINCG